MPAAGDGPTPKVPSQYCSYRGIHVGIERAIHRRHYFGKKGCDHLPWLGYTSRVGMKRMHKGIEFDDITIGVVFEKPQF